MVLDLVQVSSVDSAGLGVLVCGHRRARRGGPTLRLTGASDQLQAMLSVTGPTEVLEVFADVEAATA